MITIIITDTHFGVKQNSMTWLNSQLDFIYKQLIPYIQDLRHNNKDVRLVHMGDVFDSRSAVSTYVASKVIDAFEDLSSVVNDLVIIGGNHDYYSPKSSEINSIDLLLSNTCCKLVTQELYITENELFIPWYEWINNKDLENIIKENYIENIYTHADIVHEPLPFPKHLLVREDIKLFSGHIHIPNIDEKNHLYNIGSCYSLDFADANTTRGFYVLDGKDLKYVANKYSIKYWRIYEDELFDRPKMDSNDYIEIYISQKNLSDSKYSDIISDILKNHKNAWVIPKVQINEGNADVQFSGYDIESITADMIPEELKDKFNIILNKFKSN